MATTDEENAFAKWDIPPDPVVDEDADNPFRKFVTQKAAAPAPVPTTAPVVRSSLNTVPLAADDPRQGPTYDPDIERAKRMGTAPLFGPSTMMLSALPKSLRDAAIRPAVKAIAGLPLLPIDAATNVYNYLEHGEFTPKGAFRGLVYGAPDPRDLKTPSQRLDEMLNQVTQAPTTTGGRVAEAVSSAILGAKLPTGLPTPAAAPRVNPTRADLALLEAERQRVPMGYADYTTNPLIKKADVLAENVPVTGTAAGRAAQGKAALEAAQRLTGRYSQVAEDEARRMATTPEMRDLASEVPTTLMQTSMQRRLNALRGGATALFNRAGALLDPAGNVSTPLFNQAIGREIAAQTQRGSMANQDLVNLLEQLHDAPPGNFTAMRALRSDLGDAIRDYYAGGANKAIGEKGVERLRDIRTALEQDMGNFARGVGGDAERAWRTANDFWRTNLVPFKEKGFADLVRTAEPEKAWRYLMEQGGVDSRVVRMYNGLDTAGRAAVRAGMLEDAMSAARHPTKENVFSPAKFAKYMEDHEAVVNRFFQGNERQEINGFTNLMRHVERAGQFMENPPTGQRLIGAALVGAAPMAPKTIATMFASAGAVRFLFQSKAGRDLLIAASKLKPGSPAMHEISQSARRVLAQGAVQASGAQTAPSETESEPTEQ